MKLIEGMKLKKELVVKAADLRKKIAEECSGYDIHTPTYGTAEQQSAQLRSWLQAHQDIVKQIRKLAVAIQKTNLATSVTMPLGGEQVTLSIAEWILRRRELASQELAAWEALTDGKRKEQAVKNPDGSLSVAKVVRYYDPLLRDKMVDAFKHEPGVIDRTLEVVNATTELLGA